MTVKVIAFDLDDTLWPVRPVIMGAEKALNRWLGESIQEWPAAARNMSSIRETILANDPSLSYQLTELRCQCIAHALHLRGYEKARQIAEEAMAVFLHARHEVDYFDGAESCLSELSTRFTLGALSNGNADVRRLSIASHFSFSFSAEDVGAPKPAPNLFEAALSETDATPDEVVYVGDDPILDIDAANRFGMRSIRVINGKTTDKEGETEPDLTIENIRDLPEAIGQLS